MEYNKATILNMAKEMTRAEFLESKIVKDNCPSNFDIEDTINDTDCCDDCMCKGCWFNSIQDIKFKDDIKWIFSVEEFKNNDIAINCETKEEAEQLFNILIKNGITQWSDRTKLDRNNTDHYTYENQMCYENSLSHKISYGGVNFYKELHYIIYKFSEIDFSQVWNKESIEDVALNKPKETEEFDITKVDYITREQLNKRGFKTGDIIFLNDGYIGIVYLEYILYIKGIGCGYIDNTDFNEILSLLPVESIERNEGLAFEVSCLIKSNEFKRDLKNYIIPIQEEPKIKTICKINFVVGADNPKEFILENGQVKVGEMVEVCTGSTWQYARVKEIIEESLTDKQIKEYKVCRKLTE